MNNEDCIFCEKYHEFAMDTELYKAYGCPSCSCAKEYWIEVDPETYNPTGKICWAYYPDDKPINGFWIKVKEVK